MSDNIIQTQFTRLYIFLISGAIKTIHFKVLDDSSWYIALNNYNINLYYNINQWKHTNLPQNRMSKPHKITSYNPQNPVKTQSKEEQSQKSDFTEVCTCGIGDHQRTPD